jgi:hypothetical protein
VTVDVEILRLAAADISDPLSRMRETLVNIHDGTNVHKLQLLTQDTPNNLDDWAKALIAKVFQLGKESVS